MNMDINDRTIEQYLSDLEKYINTLLVARRDAKAKIITHKKDAVTNYTRQPPNVSNDDLKDRLDYRDAKEKPDFRE